MIYRATARLSTGQTVQSEDGSFDDCLKWAQSVRAEHDGEMTIRITQVAEAKAAS